MLFFFCRLVRIFVSLFVIIDRDTKIEVEKESKKIAENGKHIPAVLRLQRDKISSSTSHRTFGTGG